MGCDEVVECATIDEACAKALAGAAAEDAVLVTGSLYVVGGARPVLRRLIP
jgi:folylpolyglutamate synthase/dihydropteroate synthase